MKGKSVNKYEQKTESKLSKGGCDTAFYTSLRSGDKPHAETKMTFVPIKVNTRKTFESHIFTGEDPATIKKEGIQRFYTPSHIMFNSEYVEKKPKINPLKKKKYEVEQKIKESEKNPGRTRNIMQRRINDNYLRNPMRILTKEETKQYNDELTKKNEKRTDTYRAILGSKAYSRTLGGIRRPKSQLDIKVNYNTKITDNNFDITKRSMQLNKNKENNGEVPYYGKRHFVCVSYGKGHLGYL